MRVGIATDHGGFWLKEGLLKQLIAARHDVVDFGARVLDPGDDYPDFVTPLAQAVAAGTVQRGVAVCGSGVGACVAANKFKGIRAATCHDPFSARQSVEDDDVNVLCLGARVIGSELAMDLIRQYMGAKFSGLERHRRRLNKIAGFEQEFGRENA